MKPLKVSKDCIIPKSVSAIKQALLTGRYLMGCTYDRTAINIDNVFRYDAKQNWLEIYSTESDLESSPYICKLVLEAKISTDGLSEDYVTHTLRADLKQFDIYVIDNFNCLNTKNIKGDLDTCVVIQDNKYECYSI